MSCAKQRPKCQQARQNGRVARPLVAEAALARAAVPVLGSAPWGSDLPPVADRKRSLSRARPVAVGDEAELAGRVDRVGRQLEAAAAWAVPAGRLLRRMPRRRPDNAPSVSPQPSSPGSRSGRLNQRSRRHRLRPPVAARHQADSPVRPA